MMKFSRLLALGLGSLATLAGVASADPTGPHYSSCVEADKHAELIVTIPGGSVQYDEIVFTGQAGDNYQWASVPASVNTGATIISSGDSGNLDLRLEHVDDSQPLIVTIYTTVPTSGEVDFNVIFAVSIQSTGEGQAYQALVTASEYCEDVTLTSSLPDGTSPTSAASTEPEVTSSAEPTASAPSTAEPTSGPGDITMYGCIMDSGIIVYSVYVPNTHGNFEALTLTGAAASNYHWLTIAESQDNIRTDPRGNETYLDVTFSNWNTSGNIVLIIYASPLAVDDETSFPASFELTIGYVDDSTSVFSPIEAVADASCDAPASTSEAVTSEAPTSSAEDTPTSTSAEVTPTSSEEAPTSSSAEETPTSSAEVTPISSSAEETPTSSAEEAPTSSSAEEAPTSSSAEEAPTSSSAEETPTSSAETPSSSAASSKPVPSSSVPTSALPSGSLRPHLTGFETDGEIGWVITIPKGNGPYSEIKLTADENPAFDWDYTETTGGTSNDSGDQNKLDVDITDVDGSEDYALTVYGELHGVTTRETVAATVTLSIVGGAGAGNLAKRDSKSTTVYTIAGSATVTPVASSFEPSSVLETESSSAVVASSTAAASSVGSSNSSSSAVTSVSAKASSTAISASSAVSSSAASSSSSGSSSSASSSMLTVVTTVLPSTTVVTITSCSDGKCTATPVTTGLTTITNVDTVYTTYCPLTGVATTKTYTPVVLTTTISASPESTTTLTITSCSDNKCSSSVVTTGLAKTTGTVDGTTTVYTTYCPLSDETLTTTVYETSTVVTSSAAKSAEAVSTQTGAGASSSSVVPGVASLSTFAGLAASVTPLTGTIFGALAFAAALFI